MAADEALGHQAAVDVLLRVQDEAPALRGVGQVEDVGQRRREAVSRGVLARVVERRVSDRAARADERPHAGRPDGRHRRGHELPGDAGVVLAQQLDREHVYRRCHGCGHREVQIVVLVAAGRRRAVLLVGLAEPLDLRRRRRGDQRDRAARLLQVLAGRPSRAVGALEPVDQRHGGVRARDAAGSRDRDGHRDDQRRRPHPATVVPVLFTWVREEREKRVRMLTDLANARCRALLLTAGSARPLSIFVCVRMSDRSTLDP